MKDDLIVSCAYVDDGQKDFGKNITKWYSDKTLPRKRWINFGYCKKKGNRLIIDGRGNS